MRTISVHHCSISLRRRLEDGDARYSAYFCSTNIEVESTWFDQPSRCLPFAVAGPQSSRSSAKISKPTVLLQCKWPFRNICVIDRRYLRDSVSCLKRFIALTRMRLMPTTMIWKTPLTILYGLFSRNPSFCRCRSTSDCWECTSSVSPLAGGDGILLVYTVKIPTEGDCSLGLLSGDSEHQRSLSSAKVYHRHPLNFNLYSPLYRRISRCGSFRRRLSEPIPPTLPQSPHIILSLGAAVILECNTRIFTSSTAKLTTWALPVCCHRRWHHQPFELLRPYHFEQLQSLGGLRVIRSASVVIATTKEMDIHLLGQRH